MQAFLQQHLNSKIKEPQNAEGLLRILYTTPSGALGLANLDAQLCDSFLRISLVHAPLPAACLLGCPNVLTAALSCD